MNKDLLHELFTYKDGQLFWRSSSRGRKKTFAGGIDKHSGYFRICINRTIYRANRLIWVYHNGDIPDGLYVDHINRIKEDNSIDNLRLVTHQENLFNSKSKGYYFNKVAKKYQAYIRVNTKLINLGVFPVEGDARKAYLVAKEKYHIIKKH
jgi:hypothetical protein